MSRIHKSNKLIYFFYLLALSILFGSIYIYKEFEQTSLDIKVLNMESNIQYIDNITLNITALINNSTPDGIYVNLKKDSKLRKKLEKSLQLLITKRYRYVYVVDKHNKKFRFLLDGAKHIDDKSEFLESYVPINIKYWNEVYKTKKALYYQDENLKSLWLTYLKPILRDGEVKAIIAIDFSLEEQTLITASLKKLTKTFILVTLFSISIFFIIIFFSYIDKKRIRTLQIQKKEIKSFNATLQEKVNLEVSKNKEKDNMLLQQSKLAQMGEMISMIAHQWRQPLSAISATSCAIELGAQLDRLDKEQTIELASKITDYTMHLSSTIDDFRKFFKSNKKKIETNYTDIIQDVLKIVQGSIDNKAIELKQELNCADNLFTYANEIKQVILNLLKNAEDILVEKKIQNPYIKLRTFKEGNNLILEVSDNAGGVPADIVDKIFEPYFSTKTKKNGTGLGLYMSKTIIEEHCNGRLSVSNDKNGAVFRITIQKIKVKTN